MIVAGVDVGNATTEVALAHASSCSAWPPMVCSKKASPGCVRSRFSSQLSRGTTQVIASGATPRSSSQVAVSIAVLPAPRIAQRGGGARPASRDGSASAPGGTTRAPSATAKPRTCVAGTFGLR